MIVYGSRFGSTKGIVTYMGYILQENDIHVEVYDVNSGLPSNIDLTRYDRIFIGTSIKFGKWVPGVEKFLRAHAKFINENSEKFAIFIICGNIADPAKYEMVHHEYYYDVLEKYDLPELYYGIFAGILDFRPNSKFGWWNTLLLKLRTRFDSKRTIPLDMSGYNDFIDWLEIADFIYNFPIPNSILLELV